MQNDVLQFSPINLLDFDCCHVYCIIKSLKTEGREQNLDVATQCGC